MSALLKPLLVLRSSGPLSTSQHELLMSAINPTAREIGAAALVIGDGLDASLHQDQGPIVQALLAHTDAMQDLTATIQAMIYAMADQGEGDEPEPTSYLNGAPRR